MTGYATRAEEATAEALRKEVERRFGARPADIAVARAPYRICPLGAHVDHQLGRVTGVAVDRSVLLAFAPSGSARVRLASLDYPGEVSFALDAVPPPEPGSWGNYARGAALALRRDHALRTGIVGVLRGSLPAGGASSSAAVGVACLLALERANGLDIAPPENVRHDQSIENDYVGLQNGILDPSVILLSRKGALLHLDCRTRQHEAVPFGGDPRALRILLVHSGIRRALVSTDYNRHVEECRQAAELLLRWAGLPVAEQPLLGHVPREVFEALESSLVEPLRRRARHFFEETARVGEGTEAWRRGDLARFGALMDASCRSSIENYRCGCPELVALHEILRSTDGVIGSRFSGAGYGGCALALVEPAEEERISAEVEARYLEAHPERRDGFEVFPCDTADGACIP